MHSNSWLRYPQFIHQLTGNKKEKGANGLTSCTQGITEFAVMTSKGRYVFVDTPGFDDTYRSDRDILRTIANWLEEKYGSSPCIFFMTDS